MLQHFLNVIFHYSHHIYYVKRKTLFIFPNIVAELLFLTFFFGLHNSVFIRISWYLLFQSFVIKNCVVLLFGLFLTQSSISMKVIDDSDLQMGNTHVRRVIYWHRYSLCTGNKFYYFHAHAIAACAFSNHSDLASHWKCIKESKWEPLVIGQDLDDTEFSKWSLCDR